MLYQFDVDLAERYGVDEAIFCHRLFWMVQNNAANGRNLRDGRTWTYDTQAALAKIFHFWSRRQVQRVIQSCLQKGLILTADYNDDRTNRTTWYTVTDVVLQAYIHPEKPDEAMHQTVQSNAPNGATDGTKPFNVYKEQLEDLLEDNIGSEAAKAPNAVLDKPFPATKPDPWYDYAAGDKLLLSALRDFEVMRNKRKKPMTDRSRRVLAGKLDTLSGGDSKAKVALLEQSIVHCWDSVYPLKGEDAPGPGTETRRRETKEL